MAFTRFSRLLTRADVDEALGQLLEHGLVGRDALTQPVDVELAHVLAGVVDTQMEPLELGDERVDVGLGELDRRRRLVIHGGHALGTIEEAQLPAVDDAQPATVGSAAR